MNNPDNAAHSYSEGADIGDPNAPATPENSILGQARAEIAELKEQLAAKVDNSEEQTRRYINNDEHGNVIWVTEPVRSPGCDPDNPGPDLIDTINSLEDQLAAANNRIAELENALRTCNEIITKLIS